MRLSCWLPVGPEDEVGIYCDNPRGKTKNPNLKSQDTFVIAVILVRACSKKAGPGAKRRSARTRTKWGPLENTRKVQEDAGGHLPLAGEDRAVTPVCALPTCCLLSCSLPIYSQLSCPQPCVPTWTLCCVVSFRVGGSDRSEPSFRTLEQTMREGTWDFGTFWSVAA